MNSLFLAWQAPQQRAWFPIGRLDADLGEHRYGFNYTKGALQAREGVVPANRRVLVEFTGRFPQDVEPMSSESFRLIGETTDCH